MLDCKKLSNLINILNRHKIKGCLMGPGYNLEYITGIKPFQDERFKGLFVLADGRRFFICPELYYEDFRKELGEDTHMYVWSDNDGVLGTFEKAAKDYGLKDMSISIDDAIRGIDLLDMNEIMKANFINKSDIFKDLRIIKDKEEVEYLAKASEIADKTFDEIVKFIRPGVSEKDIADKIKELLIEFGGEELSFEPIVASGPNGSMPHYNDDKRVIEEQDLVILDFGCRYKGYCSDTSRTVFIGEPTEEQKKVYEIVLRANREAEKAVKEGVTAGEIDRIARKIITDEGYGEYFINRTGHGIGVEIHEEPFIKEGNKEILKSGMAFSVEPGIYIPGKFGMRVEDIVIVDGEKARILNKSNKEMTIV